MRPRYQQPPQPGQSLSHSRRRGPRPPPRPRACHKHGRPHCRDTCRRHRERRYQAGALCLHQRHRSREDRQRRRASLVGLQGLRSRCRLRSFGGSQKFDASKSAEPVNTRRCRIAQTLCPASIQGEKPISHFGSGALFLFLGTQPRNPALHSGVLGMRSTAQRRPPKTYGERASVTQTAIRVVTSAHGTKRTCLPS